MAEVTIRLPNRQTLLVIEPGVEVTVKEAPPSMTYKGQFPTVGMGPTVAFVTYLDENPNELTIETERVITNDVEISASTKRTIESDDPVLVEIEASTQRFVTNDVEITIPTVRNVTSFKVDLEIGTRRDVIVSGDMEIKTTRHVEARIEIEAATVRNVLNNEDSEIGIPTKEYGSFVEKNKLFRVQHDVLNEDVSDNPYFEKQISNLRNAALLTRNQTVIKAINELFVSQREAFVSTFTALEKVNTTIGDIVTDKTLRAQYAKIGAESVIDGLVKLSANIDTIIDFIGMQAESLDYYKELGYDDLLAALKGMNEKIKSIDFDWDDLTEDELAWMFRSTDYIPEIKDQVFTLLQQMQDEIDAFKNGTTRQFLNLKSETESILARQYQALIDKITSSHDITTKEEIQALADRLLRVESAISEMTGGSVGVPESEIRRIVLEILQNEGLEPRVISTINSLVDRITAQEEESNRLRQRLDTLEESNTVLTQNLDSLSSSITTKFNNFTEDVDNRVSSISSALENVEQAIEGTVKYEALTNLSSELTSTNSRVQELDNRVTGLEEKVETAFTEDDVVNEEEIRSLFDFTSWVDNYEVVSEDDIYKMFDTPTDDEGNPQPTTTEKVQEILDIVADESEIYGMFPDLIEQAESQQQGD